MFVASYAVPKKRKKNEKSGMWKIYKGKQKQYLEEISDYEVYSRQSIQFNLYFSKFK